MSDHVSPATLSPPEPASTQDPDQVLAVEIQAEAEDGKRFYLLARRASADQPVETTAAKNSVFASEAFLLEDIASSVPVPPWKNGVPQRREDPELLACRTKDGRCFLVGEVDWPQGTEMSHGALWSTFTEKERGYIEKVWAWLALDPLDERPAPPRWPP